MSNSLDSLLGFTAADLPANRNDVLSGRQALRLWLSGGGRLGLVAASVALVAGLTNLSWGGAPDARQLLALAAGGFRGGCRCQPGSLPNPSVRITKRAQPTFVKKVAVAV